MKITKKQARANLGNSLAAVQAGKREMAKTLRKSRGGAHGHGKRYTKKDRRDNRVI